MIDFLERRFEENAGDEAIVWNGEGFSYAWLSEKLREWRRHIERSGIERGQVVVLEADFSPSAVALFLALVDRGCILVPLTSAVAAKRDELVETAQAEIQIEIGEDDEAGVRSLARSADHELYGALRERGHPGLVLFSSGSTGKSKGAVHDLTHLLEKFRVPRHRFRSLSFLLFDHIGGVNTMLYALANGGCLVTVRDRSPESVLTAVQEHRVELLPTTPTFLNLILISEAYRHYDLSTLRMVTYGTEPVAETTLTRFHRILPDVRLLQTYGLSEIGILRSKSESSDSLWVKIGGEGFETRVVDGILHVKARSAMLGYLNAPSPFTEDGWLDTRDRVERRGEYFRILGRDSDVINVGGEKVYPAEVECVIQEVENVAEVTVYGEKHPIMGNIACARVSMVEEEEEREFTRRIKRHCRQRLERSKVPVKIQVLRGKQHGPRFKKLRLTES